jgi:hypothetical protein
LFLSEPVQCNKLKEQEYKTAKNYEAKFAKHECSRLVEQNM